LGDKTYFLSAWHLDFWPAAVGGAIAPCAPVDHILS